MIRQKGGVTRAFMKKSEEYKKGFRIEEALIKKGKQDYEVL